MRQKWAGAGYTSLNCTCIHVLAYHYIILTCSLVGDVGVQHCAECHPVVPAATEVRYVDLNKTIFLGLQWQNCSKKLKRPHLLWGDCQTANNRSLLSKRFSGRCFLLMIEPSRRFLRQVCWYSTVSRRLTRTYEKSPNLLFLKTIQRWIITWTRFVSSLHFVKYKALPWNNSINNIQNMEFTST